MLGMRGPGVQGSRFGIKGLRVGGSGVNTNCITLRSGVLCRCCTGCSLCSALYDLFVASVSGFNVQGLGITA